MKRILLMGMLLFQWSVSAQVGMMLQNGNDYLTTPIQENAATFSTGSLSLECWIKSPAAPSTNNGYSGPIYGNIMGIYWNHLNGAFVGSAAIQAANSNFISASFGAMSADTWYHLAMTYDGTTLRTYKNGVLITTISYTGGLYFANGGTINLGKHPSQNYYFNGIIDEVRIWNIARSNAEISSNMTSSIQLATPGLIASYTFEEGVPFADNTARLTATDYSGNNNHADLTHVLRYGNASNYCGTVSNFSAPTNSSLNFSGSNTFVTTGMALRSANFSSITIEAWVKGNEAPSNTAHTGPVYGMNAALVWHHGTAAFRGAASVETANGTFYAASFGSLSAATWYHLALTYDGATLKSYKNGVMMNSVAAPGGLKDHSELLMLGRHPSISNFFGGSVDEVRIWNVARTCSEINSTMNQRITTPQANLVLNYGFDNTYPEGVNTSHTNESDLSGSNFNGGLFNFNLFGSSSNYVTSAPMNLPTSTPTITQQPVSVTSCGGTAASFGVTLGFASFTYQWQVDDGNGFVNITSGVDYSISSGVGVSTLMVNSPQVSMSCYKYRCLVSNSGACGGTTTSNEAILTVQAIPTVMVSGPSTACEAQNFTLTASGADTYAWSNGGTDANNTITAGAGGMITYNVSGTQNGCSATASHTIQILSRFVQYDTVTICSGASYTFPDMTSATSSQSHTSSYLGANGCDSLIITELIVLQPIVTNQTVHICNGASYTFPDMTSTTVSATNTSTLSSISGCDSTVITQVIVDNPFTGTENVSICFGSTYTFPDQTTGSGNMTHTSLLTGMGGCDSTIVTFLTEMPANTVFENASICNGQVYTFPDGAVGNTAQTHTSILQSYLGCDSTIVTTLNVNFGNEFQSSTPICLGSTYTFEDGTTYTANDLNSFTHTSVFQTINGCDSIYITTVHILPNSTSQVDLTMCYNASYTFPDGSFANITANTVQTSTLTNIQGCDSIIVTNITVLPQVLSNFSYDGLETLSVNANGTVQWFDCNSGFSIDGETGLSFTPSVSGLYGVIGTSTDGCVEQSECIQVNLVSLDQLNKLAFSLAPNPAQDYLEVKIGSKEEVKLRIFNALGQSVLESSFKEQTTIALDKIPTGLYFVTISLGKQSVSSRFVKE